MGDAAQAFDSAIPTSSEAGSLVGGGGVVFVVHGSNDVFDGEYARAEGGKNSRPRCRRVGREDATCWFSHGHWRLGGVTSTATTTTYFIKPPAHPTHWHGQLGCRRQRHGQGPDRGVHGGRAGGAPEHACARNPGLLH